MISTNPPEWLANGASNNYHDFVALDRLARVMNCSENSIDEDDGVCAPSGNVVVVASGVKGNKEGETKPENEFLARIPLCLHCRKPASQLCQGCLGAYFCSPPAMCFVEGYVLIKYAVTHTLTGEWACAIVSTIRWSISQLFLYAQLVASMPMFLLAGLHGSSQ